MSWAVEAHELTRSFGDLVAVNGLSFAVKRGEIFGFLGSNGAGKTTTIRMLCGLLRPTAGRVMVLGLDVASHGLVLRQRIGYMSQKFSLYRDLTVEENLLFWGTCYGLSGTRLDVAVQAALEQGDLKHVRADLVRQLPVGFRQRLALATVLLHRPELVFLDEPTSGVDPQARRDFWDLIDRLSSQGTTVLVTTHAMDEAERCHRVAFMHAGRIVAMDSVSGLKGRIPRDQLIAITSPGPDRVLKALQGQPEVQDLALFGHSCQVLLRTPQDLGRIQETLRAAGCPFTSLQPVAPSLEDAFVFLIPRPRPPGESTP
ncbi:MAG: ABC transporter ATP-binding protein [Thermoanaerobaculum sp.]|nr:ABC transporter ATP-binding protein [Thermoanaerobaculum sp.]MDW7966528.1 ABC transporter ATP-binding protein [Thermoanaerobaculum sp.]